MATVVQRQATQISSITRMSEKMRRSYYTTNVEKMLNGNQPMYDQESLLLFRSNDQYIDYLKDWYFVKTLVGFFSDPLAEIINKTDFASISIDNDTAQRYETWVNNRLFESNLKGEILSDIDSIVYTGKFFRLMMPTVDETFKFLKINDETGVDMAYQLDDCIGYLVNPGAESDFVIKSKAFGSAYGYRNIQTKNISDLDPQILKVLKDKLDIDKLPKSLREKVVGLETRTPTSPFYDQAGLLFKVYLYEMLEWFNSLKSTYRQDLLSITLDSDTKDVVEASRVVQSIENVVNQDSSVIYDQSVQTLISRLIANSLNNVRVLPAVDAYARAEFLKWNDRSDENEKLTQDSETAKNMILNSMGIPQELLGATSNRWEILSRSERYLTTMTTYLDFITDIVKSCVQSLLLNKGITVSKDEIRFDMKNDSDIQSQIARRKIARLEDDTMKLSNIINNTQILMGSGYFDPSRMLNELINSAGESGILFGNAFKDSSEIMDMLAAAGGQ